MQPGEIAANVERVFKGFVRDFVRVVGENGEFMGPDDHVREKHREFGKCEVCLRSEQELERRTLSRAQHRASLAACRQCWDMFNQSF